MIGPTGKFPGGRMRDDDKGELNIGFSHVDGQIIIAFTTPVTWIGCDPEDARAIANELLRLADEAEHFVVVSQGN